MLKKFSKCQVGVAKARGKGGKGGEGEGRVWSSREGGGGGDCPLPSLLAMQT